MKKRALTLVDQIDRLIDRTIAAHTKTFWGRGGATGERDRSSYEKNSGKLTEKVAELRSLIEKLDND